MNIFHEYFSSLSEEKDKQKRNKGEKMLIKRIKKMFYFVIIVINIFCIFESIYIKKTFAFEKNERLFRMMDKMDAREVKIHDNVFHVYTNQDEKFILVRGIVSDLPELEKIEKYFILRSPSTYQLKFDIDFTQ